MPFFLALDASESSAASFSDIQSAMSTGLGSIKDDLIGMLVTVLPIALGIVGIGIAITYGIKYFKKVKG